MFKSLKYSFCTINVYNSFVISSINEGFHLTPDKNKVLEEIANDYFSNNPFAYISHRKHSYSVDPSIYLQTSKIKNLIGMAVVAEVPLAKGNAQIEKLFLDKPFEIFSSLDDAIKWAKSLTADE
ncbi:hypothetical protein [Pontimicrobium aquaticum]|uniref:STAS/SEC14 domain-containing protein n=1 Tax=Pontimicrobium aquaticum TaxID=2565367 RepID=A0A4U0ELK5_9FLAO|nr:hypothetical protein [Pontimicrobium aquaticum]TJY31884.1 hypothetical protein E5167_14845 [Pontimicrobium aquaticum]